MKPENPLSHDAMLSPAPSRYGCERRQKLSRDHGSGAQKVQTGFRGVGLSGAGADHQRN